MTDTSKLSAGEQKKIVYDDDAIRKRIKELSEVQKGLVAYYAVEPDSGYGKIITMLQQLLDERDALLKDLKALEAEVRAFRIDKGGIIRADTDRSEKYDTEKPD